MATPVIASQQHCNNIPNTNNDEDADQHIVKDFQKTYKKYREILPTLPKKKGWMSEYLVQYKGFWLSPESGLKGAILIQDHFKPQPTDIVLATYPKTGTTWLKALIFTTLNRTSYDFSSHPLLTTGPHDCFCFMDTFIYQNDQSISNLDALASPRLLSTHIPYSLLPKSMTKYSSCRFVYICRNPKDVLISKWIFMNKVRSKELTPLSLEEAFELFCEGISHFGPLWDHVLEYWKASLESPDRVLFLKYEDMKRDPMIYVKRLAEFLGKPFSEEEENEGVVQEVIKLCSFESLSNLEINKTNVTRFSKEIVVDNGDFFRKGQVGDWKNHLTVEIEKRLDQITEDKLYGSGLTFGASALPTSG